MTSELESLAKKFKVHRKKGPIPSTPNQGSCLARQESWDKGYSSSSGCLSLVGHGMAKKMSAGLLIKSRCYSSCCQSNALKLAPKEDPLYDFPLEEVDIDQDYPTERLIKDLCLEGKVYYDPPAKKADEWLLLTG